MKRKTNSQLPAWAVTLIVIAAFDLLLAFEYFCIVKIPAPVGAFCGLLVVVDLLIWGILSAAFSNWAPSMSIIGEKELGNAMRLLRYATAILSFLSLTTTASGMKSFVFDTDWKAYLGSFAVQSILVVFSLLLCHFYVMIGTLPRFGKAAKALMLGALTVFFAAALVVSSCFSYVYIAGNAYKDSWTGDSKTLIQEYLLRESAALKERNAFLGEQFLKNIGNDLQNILEGDIKSYLEKKGGEVSEEISNFKIEEYTDEQKDLAGIDITLTVELLEKDRKARPKQLEEIKRNYNTIGRDVLERAFQDYAKAAQKVSDLVKDGTSDDAGWMEKTVGELGEISQNMQGIITRLDNAVDNVGNLSTNFYVNDIEPIKTTFKSTAVTFRNFVQEQKDTLDGLIAKADAAVNDTSSPENASATDQLETIRREIYLLDPQQSDLDSEIPDIIRTLSGLLDKLSESEAVTTDSIASLTSLTERINEYGKSLALSNDIQEFMENDLGQVYSFDENGEGGEDTWRSTRDGSFKKFLSMLHDLPDPQLLEETDRNEYTQKGYRDADVILKETERIRRDLLGDLTAFEKSLNYFKYDFRKMAIFSAFVAVFLDLGAFLTGCFLYSARHIRTGEVEESPDGAEAETESESESAPETEPEKVGAGQ